MLLNFGMKALMNAAQAAAAGEAVSQTSDFFRQWLEGLNVGAVVLLVIGIALLIVEMLMPGFGIAGLAGVAAVIAGLAVGSETMGAALFSLAIVFVILLIAAPIAFKTAFGKKKHPNRLVLDDRIDSASNTRSGASAKALIGRKGVALTALRPSGIAMIDNRRIDVLAEGEFIAKGDSIVVKSVNGTRIGVAKPGGNGEDRDN